MRKVALFPNALKDQSLAVAGDILRYLVQRGVAVYAEDAEAAALGAAPLSEVTAQEIEFIITLGGDGTILRAIHNHQAIDAPVMAINMGGLGFMADIPLDEIYASLDSLLAGNFTVQKRLVMEGHSQKNQRCLAVNDIVVHRARNPSLVDLSIHVDGIYLNTFSADGIIISTPTGSTAYSMAAGGPILAPELDALVLTPICPHTVSNRPIVLLPKVNIEIQYTSRHSEVEITSDGFPRYVMSSGESFFITRSKRFFKLVSLPHHDYFSTLRKKLGWGWASRQRA